MIPTELISGAHTFITAFYYIFTSQYKKYFMVIWMYKPLQILSAKTFRFHYTGKERENFPVLLSLIRHCLSTN